LQATILLILSAILLPGCGPAKPDGVDKGDYLAPARHNPPGTRMDGGG
jgi:hypothetical protein